MRSIPCAAISSAPKHPTSSADTTRPIPRPSRSSPPNVSSEINNAVTPLATPLNPQNAITPIQNRCLSSDGLEFAAWATCTVMFRGNVKFGSLLIFSDLKYKATPLRIKAG